MRAMSNRAGRSRNPLCRTLCRTLCRSLMAGAGIAALTLTPALTFTPALAQADTGNGPTVDEHTLGPAGYKTLQLGMNEGDAVATGLIANPEQVGNCTWFYLSPSEGGQHPASGVVISPARGVVSIPGTQTIPEAQGSHTPEGITMGAPNNDQGSPTQQIEDGYPYYTVDKTGPVPLYLAPAPGNGAAHYRFVIGQDDRVKDMVLNANDDGGCGLND